MSKIWTEKSSWLWLAWVVAMVAVLGSLYFSEIKGWEPCVLCWYQRIAMYPLVVVLFIASKTRDVNVAKYVLPVITIGGLISIYHYLLQWGIFAETCGVTSVSCAYVPHKWFGFLTLPLLALVAFGLIGFSVWKAGKKWITKN